MVASVLFETPTGGTIRLPHESIIGRMTSAALRIDDPRISEAHALVSVRGDALHLLALRGRLSLDGKPATSVRLMPEMRVVLAGYYALTVLELSLPGEVPTLLHHADGHTCAVPIFGVLSVFAGAPDPLRLGFDPSADAYVWQGERGVVLRVGDLDRALPWDTPTLVAGAALTVVATPWVEHAIAETVDRGHFDVALTLTLRYDVVSITSPLARACHLDNLQARAICELHAIGAPIGWQGLAALLWPDAAELAVAQLRARWDQLLLRIRAKLRESGIRADLVRSSRPGLVELCLGPDDRVIDET